LLFLWGWGKGIKCYFHRSSNFTHSTWTPH
jgi:hypothetical protein